MDESILSKSDNIDSIKYIAAVMVIICHSFVLSTTELGSWAQFMNNHIAFGAIGVAIFFFLSGLLVTQSMMRYKSVKKFLKVRALRIFPPLAVVVTLTMVMGMFITNLQVQDYWLNPNTLRYLLNIVLIRQHYLPGVFENNPYAGAVNGSLWTLLFEFICYILTCIVYKLKMLARHHILLTIPIMIVSV